MSTDLEQPEPVKSDLDLKASDEAEAEAGNAGELSTRRAQGAAFVACSGMLALGVTGISYCTMPNAYSLLTWPWQNAAVVMVGHLIPTGTALWFCFQLARLGERMAMPMKGQNHAYLPNGGTPVEDVLKLFTGILSPRIGN